MPSTFHQIMSILLFRLNYSLKLKVVLPCIMSRLSTGLLPISDCNKTLLGTYIHVLTHYPFQLSYSIKKTETKKSLKDLLFYKTNSMGNFTLKIFFGYWYPGHRSFALCNNAGICYILLVSIVTIHYHPSSHHCMDL